MKTNIRRSSLKRNRRYGFRRRRRTHGGRMVIKRRRAKGKKRLTSVN